MLIDRDGDELTVAVKEERSGDSLNVKFFRNLSALVDEHRWLVFS